MLWLYINGENKQSDLMKFLQFLLLLLPVASLAQDSVQYVVSNAGSDFQSASTQVSWTIGEVATETLVSSNYIVSQGFHQGNLLVDRIDEDVPLDFSIRVYPNPVQDILHVETEDIDMEYRIIDVDSRVRISGTIISELQQIDLTVLPAGTYFLQVEKHKTHKIIKY